MSKRLYVNGNLEDRFWPRVHKTAGCWLWTAATMARGYGVVCLPNYGGPMGAHRASWIIHYGAIPAGLQVLHRCDNPPCVRPSHLFLGNRHDNMRDCAAKGRVHTSRLSPPSVREIRRLIASGERNVDVARRYGVSPAAISHIRHHRTWVLV